MESKKSWPGDLHQQKEEKPLDLEGTQSELKTSYVNRMEFY
jgi:hypothetical protein